MRIKRDVSYTQAKNCRWCLHVGRTAYLFGKGVGKGAVLEIATPRRFWRFRPAQRTPIGPEESRRLPGAQSSAE